MVCGIKPTHFQASHRSGGLMAPAGRTTTTLLATALDLEVQEGDYDGLDDVLDFNVNALLHTCNLSCTFILHVIVHFIIIIM